MWAIYTGVTILCYNFIKNKDMITKILFNISFKFLCMRGSWKIFRGGGVILFSKGVRSLFFGDFYNVKLISLRFPRGSSLAHTGFRRTTFYNPFIPKKLNKSVTVHFIFLQLDVLHTILNQNKLKIWQKQHNTNIITIISLFCVESYLKGNNFCSINLKKQPLMIRKSRRFGPKYSELVHQCELLGRRNVY